MGKTINKRGELIQQCSMCEEKYQCYPFSHKYLLHQITNHWSNEDRTNLSLLIEENISTSTIAPVQDTFCLIDNFYYTIVTTIKRAEHSVEINNDQLLSVNEDEPLFNYINQMENQSIFINDLNQYSENETFSNDCRDDVAVVVSDEFLCQICDKKFENKITITAHLDSVHNNSVLSQSQSLLSLSISNNNKDNLVVDTTSVNSFVTLPPKINDATDITSTKDIIKKDIGGRPRKIHITEKIRKFKKSISPIRYKCEFCNKEFTRKSYYETHKKRHDKLNNRETIVNKKSTLSNTKEHLCPICGKIYLKGYHLKLHLYVHGDERPLKCDICDKGFVIKNTLRDHMRIHTGERPYKCKFVGCDKSFKLASANRQHFISVHSGIKRFECEQCDKKYAKKIHFQEHLRKHTGELPFKCAFCPKKFRLSVTLRAHTKTHTGERPFTCHICNKGFIKSHNLKMHLSAKRNCADKLSSNSNSQGKDNKITALVKNNI